MLQSSWLTPGRSTSASGATNTLERLIREHRRRLQVISVFPNHASALRFLGAYLTELDEDWSTGKRYFSMWDYWGCKQPVAPQQHVPGWVDPCRRDMVLHTNPDLPPSCRHPHYKVK